MATSHSEHTPTIAVIGATGQQGGATAQALLDAGAAVGAVVRDPGRPAAKELRERGAQLVTADLGQTKTLTRRSPGSRTCPPIRPTSPSPATSIPSCGTCPAGWPTGRTYPPAGLADSVPRRGQARG
jgi:hypothetical protein